METVVESRYSKVGYQSAVACSIVAGVYTLVTLMLLGANFYLMRVVDLQRQEVLATMKQQLVDNPTDVMLANQMREYDATLRRDVLRRPGFARRGMMLFGGSLAVLVVSFVWARRYAPVSPEPEPVAPADAQRQQVQQALTARLAVTVTLVLLGAVGVFMVVANRGGDALKGGVQATTNPAMTEPADAKGAMDSSHSGVAAVAEDVGPLEVYWGGFRGPGGLGIAEFDNIPVEWDGLLWHVDIPLAGHSSPVICGDRIFVSGASRDVRKLFCYAVADGRLLWEGEVGKGAAPGMNEDFDLSEETTYAAPTPITDGQRVCAVFANGDIGCYTVNGKPLWTVRLGVPESSYGYASSPTWHEGSVYVQWDVGFEQGGCRLMALDWATGEISWQTDRPGINNWTSPTVVQVGDEWQVLTTTVPWAIGYEVATGKEIWRAECLDGELAPTQIVVDGRVMIGVEPYSQAVGLNLKGAAGNISESGILWQAEGTIPDICSPVSDGTYFYLLDSAGTFSCFQVDDGQMIYEHELEMDFQASPVLAEGRLYLLSYEGVMVIAQAGPEFKELYRSELGVECFASPAFMPGRIVVRGKDKLVCLGAAE